MGYLTMSNKEREQLKVFEKLKLKEITQKEAAAKLGMSARWVREKLKRYLQNGDAGLIHKSRGKESGRRWDDKEKQITIDLLKSDWHGFGPKFTSEKLAELYKIKVDKETVRQAMMAAGIWQGKKVRNKHRKRRDRRPMFGMMVQLDGSPHDWFEGRAGRCTLLVFIDDATSEILWLEFVDSESTMALLQATKNYIQAHGIPHEFYVDHGGVFHVNLNNKEHEKITQWERAVEQMGIKVIHAHSPQAKGRVERCNQTMQDRLVKELRLAEISSMSAGNEYLRTSNFIQKHNAEFSSKAAQGGNAHADHQSYDLDNIFCIKETRILMNDFTITFNKRIFQLQREQRTILRSKNEIEVRIHLDHSIKLFIRKVELHFNEIRVRQPQVKEPQFKEFKPRKINRAFIRGAYSESRMKRPMPAAEAKS